MAKRPTIRTRLGRAQIVWRRWGDWRKLVLALCTGVILAAILLFQFIPDKVDVGAGEVARQDIYAPRFVRYKDAEKTELFRALAGAQVQPIYSAVLYAESETRQSVRSFLSKLDEHVQNGPDRRRVLRTILPGLTDQELRQAESLSRAELRAVQPAAEMLINQLATVPIHPDSLEDARRNARSRAGAQSLSATGRAVLGAVVSAALVPNRYLNQRETEEARQRERDKVPAYYETIQRGDLIVRKGERISEEQITRLAQVGLIRARVNLASSVSLVLLSFGLVAVFCLYVYQFHLRVLRSFSSLLLVSVVVCGCMFLFRGLSTAVGLQFTGDQLGFLGTMTSALGAMLIAALLSPQIAVFAGVSQALLTSVMVGADLRFAILAIVSSLVGVQSVTAIKNRAGILRAGVTVALANIATAVVAHCATQAALPAEIGQTAVWAGVGGLVSVMLFYFMAAWLERPFRLTTHLTLLELSDPSHPVLRRLAMEAPGTYHHSIIVGNLSEAAAEAIGADALFCRVASLYHDIGKIIRPHFFIENQSTVNRHDEINPSLSSLIIASHVKDGVELAEEHRLPPPIIAIICEHHGTCLIKYFYHRAVSSGGGGDNPAALEYQFRYEGPRPQTKESGIIMIADSAEAAARTLEKPTPGRIRDLVERIVRDRLSDAQFDECDLTFKDLEKITTSITRSLTSLLHARIEYPAGTTAADLRRSTPDGIAGKPPLPLPKALADTPATAPGPAPGIADR